MCIIRVTVYDCDHSARSLRHCGLADLRGRPCVLPPRAQYFHLGLCPRCERLGGSYLDPYVAVDVPVVVGLGYRAPVGLLTPSVIPVHTVVDNRLAVYDPGHVEDYISPLDRPTRIARGALVAGPGYGPFGGPPADRAPQAPQGRYGGEARQAAPAGQAAYAAQDEEYEEEEPAQQAAPAQRAAHAQRAAPARQTTPAGPANPSRQTGRYRNGGRSGRSGHGPSW